MSAYSLTDVLFTIPHGPAAVAILRDRTVLAFSGDSGSLT